MNDRTEIAARICAAMYAADPVTANANHVINAKIACDQADVLLRELAREEPGTKATAANAVCPDGKDASLGSGNRDPGL